MSTRERLLHAARRLATERGAARLTTRAMAEAAGVSEATLFKHFPTKDDLLLAVVREHLPAFQAATSVEQAGTGTIQERLELIARAALAHYAAMIPLSSLVLADTGLLERQRPFWEGTPGPRGPYEHVAAYLRAEQRLGRIAPDRDPLILAVLLLGPCFQWAYLKLLLGAPPLPVDEGYYIQQVVAALLEGASPSNRPPRNGSSEPARGVGQ
jgi:AcrR family transcriptional regulator